MYQVIYQDQNMIELGVDGDLDRSGFDQITHQLTSLATTFGPINVMFDLTGLENYDKGIALDEVRFYRDNKAILKQVAVVSDKTSTKLFTKLFGKLADVEVKHFPVAELDEARGWTFPSRLP